MTKMEKGLISVIIPAYRAGDYIEGAVESLRNQTVKEVEILVVNNGKDARTAEICGRICREDPRVRTLEPAEECGVSRARNLGLDAAQGEYVAFVDADDRAHPEMLEVLRRVLKSEEAGIAGCGFVSGDDLGNWQQAFDGQGVESPAEVLSWEEYLAKGILQHDTRIWSKLFRRDLIKDVRFREDMTIGEDMLFLVDLSEKRPWIARTAAPLYFYYRNPHGAMNRVFTPDYMDQVRCWDEAEKEILAAAPQVFQSGAARNKISAICCISALLVAAKIARLPGKEFSRWSKEYLECRERVRACLKTGDAGSLLSRGERIQADLLRYAPALHRMALRMRG